MSARTVRETCVTMVQVMMPQDANPAGNVHGGIIMKLIDTAAGVVAGRHARRNVVTASIDKLEFHNPVFIGDVLFLKASINLAGNTSMEIGVRAEAENPVTGEVRHTSSAYLTFVALDEDGKPVIVPGLIPESDEEKRRNREAILRKKARLELKGRQDKCCDEGICGG